MKYRITFLIVMLLAILNNHIVCSQDLSEINKKNIVTCNGGVNISGMFYEGRGMEIQQDPFSYIINARLNLSFFNGLVDAPFSAHFNSGNRALNQPTFNHFGVSPSYKWITGHFGYRSMRFSQYSLSGITFLGGGVEAEIPDSPFTIAAMAGKFANAVPYTDDANTSYSSNLFDSPGYARWGYGARISVGKNEHKASLILFRAKDQVASIPAPPPEVNIKPKENFIVALITRNQITENVSVKIEYDLSAYSSDIRAPEREMESFTYINNLGPLYTPRYSSSINGVLNGNITYSMNDFSVGIGYKRVPPGYKSLGTTYLSNDLENITINITKSLFDNKVDLSGNLGKQQNNLNNEKTMDNTRIIGSVNCNYQISKALNISTGFSNFNTTTQPAGVNIRDTFRFVQVTKNTTFNGNYSLNSNQLKSNISLTGTYQIVNTLNKTATNLESRDNEFYNINTGYSGFIVPLKMNVSLNFNYNRVVSNQGRPDNSYGPTLGLGRNMLQDQVQMNFSFTNMINQSAGGVTNYILNVFRLNTSYKINSHHSLDFSGSCLFKKMEQQNMPDSETVDRQLNRQEYRARISYNYNF